MVGMKKAWMAALVLAACAACSAASPQRALDAAFPPPVASLEGQAFEQSAGRSNFGAMVMAVPGDARSAPWKAGSVPKLAQARLVGVGDKVQLVVFLATRLGSSAVEPKDGVRYAVDIYKPDGALQERLDQNRCVSSQDKIAPGTFALCEGAVTFELEPQDPKGQWVFKVSLLSPADGEPLVFGTSFEAY